MRAVTVFSGRHHVFSARTVGQRQLTPWETGLSVNAGAARSSTDWAAHAVVPGRPATSPRAGWTALGDYRPEQTDRSGNARKGASSFDMPSEQEPDSRFAARGLAMTSWLPIGPNEMQHKEHATGADPDGVLFHICPFGEGANRVSRSGYRQFARITARRDENCVVASCAAAPDAGWAFVNYGRRESKRLVKRGRVRKPVRHRRPAGRERMVQRPG